ncbi:hypothetical protein AGR1A_pAt10021 [Agrobacterium fabacearum CFBP 5771]|uniref:hypothetical protein n=1 Tax=Agrobacterium tumefaciens TaxID=358 RepID=UPI0009BA8794|nr:hypothetical protein [Agrobacterium tumefaciens]CVI23662.1 hypothetical protein AGR1A_pAt10021 [Agrobacterium fabacearum CFBP 5771]
MKDLNETAPKKTIGPLRLAFVTVVIVFIACWEYNWLTTPWWLKTVQYCSTLTFDTVIRDIKGWVGW